MRIGQGWDRHTLTKGNHIVLGGVTVAAPFGVKAHSDGDVLVHALIDALLGAVALGDIGEHFPDTSPVYKEACSIDLLQQTCQLLHENGYLPRQIDATIMLEQPKLSPHKEEICQTLAKALGVDPSWVSLKAKTGEGVGPVGAGKAIEASVLAVVVEKNPAIWV